jgi:hypothetical protein
MRAGAVTAALAAAIALAASFGLQHSRRSEALARTAAAYPPPLVTCNAIVLRPRSLSPRDRIVLGRVAFVGARVYQAAAVGGEGPLRLWAKVGLYVRAGSRPVTLALPDAWRRRAGVTWGTGIVPALHIAGCPLPSGVWNGYAGGFYVRAPACVPLRVRVGRRSAVLRFGIGRPCADR